MFRNLSPGAIGVGGDVHENLRLAKLGEFEGLDPNLTEADEMGVEAYKGLFDDAGLKMGGWGLPVDYRGDEGKFQDGLRDLPRLAAIGQALGCMRVPTWVLPFSDTLPFEENYDRHRRRFRAIAEILKDHGCSLGLEFIGPKTSRDGHKHEFIWSMSGMLGLADDVGTGNVGLLLDGWHWYTAHGTLAELEALRPEQVVYVHVNDAPAGVDVDAQIDNIRCLPGETGVIDIAGFLKALRKIGYDGPVTPEPFSAKLRDLPPDEVVTTVRDSMMTIWRQGGLA